MTTWTLEPGCEQPVTRPRQRGAVLTAAEIVQRCEQLGARVERAGGGGSRIYPPDRAHAPISIPGRLAHGRGHLNIITALRRAGLDVHAEPPKQEPAMPSPAEMPAARRTTGTAALSDLQQQMQTVLEMLAEADARIARLTERLDVTPGAPPARNEHADLDEAILALMGRVPIALTAALIAHNLPGDAADAQLVEARLSALPGVSLDEANGTWRLAASSTP